MKTHSVDRWARVTARSAARAFAAALAVVLRAALPIAVVAGIAGSPAPAAADGLGQESVPFWERSPADLDAFLRKLQEEAPDVASRVRAILLERIGTPYVLGCLGEGAGAPPDSEPVFRLDEVDCTVLVLTTAALAHARSLSEAESNMRFANYRDVGGARPVTYSTRLHFTEDRLDASPYFANVTDRVVPESLLVDAPLVLNATSAGAPLLPIAWSRPVVLRYLPAARLSPALLAALPRVTGVAFVETSYFRKGLAVAHEGVLLDGADLVHASSESKRVVRVPFLDYLRRADGSPRFDGLLLYEFR